MQDLTQYSDDELSLQVFNDEGLYSMRHDTGNLLEVLEEIFTYSFEQMEVLLTDLADDLDECVA